MGLVTAMGWIGVGVAAIAASTSAPKSTLESLRAELAHVREKAPKDHLVQEARLLFYLGEHETGREEREAAYREGRDKAQEAKAAQPRNPDALLWWAANQGGLANVKRNLWALGAIKEIEQALQELKALDPTFGFAAAARVLGKIYQEAPRFVSIGSSSLAKENIDESLKHFPDFLANQLGLAEWLWEDGQKVHAAELAGRLKKDPSWDKPDKSEWRWERDLWRRRLDDLLQRISGRLP